MNEHDDLIARLRALGERPVEPALASRHLTAMAAVGRPRGARFGRAKVVAAFVAGLVLGTTGLASAGVMGAGVQDSLADAAAKVGVNLPGGKPRYSAGCDGYTEGMTHGQYVSAATNAEERKARAKSDCGKPSQAVERSNQGGNGNRSDNESRSECAPPWAGKGKAGKAVKAQNPDWTPPAGCPAENEARENEADDDRGNKPEETPAPQSQGNPDPQGPPSTTPAPAADQGQENKAENAPETPDRPDVPEPEGEGLGNQPEDVPPAP